jgi:cell division protein FtsB
LRSSPSPPATSGRAARPSVQGGIRRLAGPARQTVAPRRPRRVSGRTAALGVLLFALMLAYAYPVRVYLAQQAQIAQMQNDQVEQQRRIQDLAERLARWDDEEYVVAQARSRLQMVREGELLYVVGVAPTLEGDASGTDLDEWYHRLWSNLQAADEPPAP